MKIRNLLLLLCLSSASVNTLKAQTTNYALRLNGQQAVTCGSIDELAGSTSYSVQFMVAPDNWSSSSYIYRAGSGSDEFSARLSSVNGEILFKSGNKEFALGNIKVNGWSQVTLIVSPEMIQAWVNGVKSEIATSDFAAPAQLGNFQIGSGFTGRVDEFRLWNAALNTSDTDYLLLQNTVNKFHPQWENLVVYYKFDQDQCADNIVDYKFTHHGSMGSAILREPVRDNDYFRYRVVSGYSDFNRHCDRVQIDRDMHLLTNDLIILNAKVDGYTGEISMNAPDNGVFTGGYNHLDAFDGRKGVMNFDGTGVMNLGDHVVIPGSPAGNALTFEGWFNISEWKEGAYLFKKQESEFKRMNIRLGNAEKKELIIEAGGWTAVFAGGMANINKWDHLAVVVNPGSTRSPFSLYVNNVALPKPVVTKVDGSNTFEIMNINAEGTIGESFNGKIDNIMMWRQAKSSFAATMNETANELKFPGGGDGSIYLDAYLRFDDPGDPGLNLKGWKGMLKQIKDQYAGHRGYMIRLGLITSTSYPGGGKVWPDYIGKPEWRANLAKGVEKLIPYCDGIDVDFEWLDNNVNNPKWVSYGEMVKSLRKVVPNDKVLSVSLHPVSYTMPTNPEVLDAIDFITYQNYGPRPTSLYYDAYQKFFTQALNYGIPAEKIRLSMATTIVRADNSGKNVSGYKNLDFTNITADTNTAQYAGYEYTFNGVNEVKKKMRLLVEKNSGGCMYFDMGNDLSVQKELSLIRALNTVIASNVDTLVTKVPPVTGIQETTTDRKEKITVFPNPTKDFITVKGNIGGVAPVKYEICSMKGELVAKAILPDSMIISLENLPSGTYFLRLFNSESSHTEKIQIKN
ncbi:MAG: LamG-like jellyroll fold domain-containing protein [Bacteroidales bacterium]